MGRRLYQALALCFGVVFFGMTVGPAIGGALWLFLFLPGLFATILASMFSYDIGGPVWRVLNWALWIDVIIGIVLAEYFFYRGIAKPWLKGELL